MKPVLYLVGLGLSPPYISRLAASVLRSMDTVFLETYTVPGSPWTPEALEEIAGRMPVPISRRELEDMGGEPIFRELEAGRSVALAVAGDPMIATTHNALRLEALRKGFEVRIVYGVSIHCAAISASGLFAYKFGKSATIVYPRNGIVSTYPYEVLEENRSRGLHTLFYLDIRDDGRGMTVSEALSMLKMIEEREGRGVIEDTMLVIGMARIGMEDEAVIAGPLRAVEEYKRMPQPPHILIVPGKLHFMEEEALKVYMVGEQR